MARSFEHPDRDPPLDRSGELELPADLADLANQLRGEAARIAEVAVPQAAAVPLRKQLTERVRRRSVLTTVCTRGTLLALVVLLIAVVVRTGMQPQRASSEPMHKAMPSDSVVELGTSQPAVAAPARHQPLAARPPKASADESVFLSADAAPAARDPLAVELATPEEKIELLEEAVERYRSAIGYQQERLLKTEAELQRAELEIRRLREQLERMAPDRATREGAATAP